MRHGGKWDWQKRHVAWHRRGMRTEAQEEGRRERGAREEARRERRERKRSDLTPEEHAYFDAQRLAAQKVRFVRHLVPYISVVIFLLFVTRSFFVAGIVALSWGIAIGSHFFHVFLAPALRTRWTRQEVARQLQKTVHEERRVLRGQQQRSLEELSASIAHEIRNPITAAKSLVQQMGEDPGSSENVEYAKVALDELDRVERSISHLLRYAREEDMVLAPLKLADVMEGALESFRERLATLGVEVKRDFDAGGEMQGDREKLRRVLINLISNALDAFEEARTERPQLTVSLGDNLAGSGVWVRVKDNGPGIDEATQAKIFRPFFSSKEKGTGLGLAISMKLVEAHNGTLEVHSVQGRGSEFVLTFPKAAAPVSAGEVR